MFWSQRAVPGKLRVLAVDGSRNALGWEAAFCDRVCAVLGRKHVALVAGSPVRVGGPEELADALRGGAFNCIMLFCHGDGEQVPRGSTLRAFWEWLAARDDLTSKLLAVCTWESADPEAARSILTANESFAQLAVVSGLPLSPRAAGLFFMKFLTELDLHSEDSVTGKMVWFSHAKAREILKRRQLGGEIGMRC